MINNLLAGFFENIIKIFSNVKYLEMIFEGLKVTFIISLGASLLGLILGTLVAMVKIVADAKKKSKVLKVINFICDIYTTIVRGTPMALQLFIMAFVVFAIRGFPQEIVVDEQMYKRLKNFFRRKNLITPGRIYRKLKSILKK
jgi:ABC-type amino acid transport system permease subunit